MLLDMEWLPALSYLIFELGLTWAVGASTFALIFFIVALQDGNIDDSEKRLMHTVYRVLRIGKTLLMLALVLFALTPGFALTNVYIAQWFLLAVITANAILMTKHIMPMHIGPIIAGGSWYSLFFVSVLPVAGVALPTLAITYIVFLVVFYVVYNGLKRKFTQKPA